MHSFLDQVSALLSSTPINSLQNSELYKQLPASGLFSSLLSEYSNSTEDANIAALSGNFVPALSARNPLAAATGSLIYNSGDASDGIVAASTKSPALPVTTLNVASEAPVLTPHSAQLQQGVAETVGKEPLNKGVAGSGHTDQAPNNLNLLEEARSFSKLSPVDSSKAENFPRPSSSDQLLQPVNHRAVHESQNDSRVHPLRNTAPQTLSTEQPIPTVDKSGVREPQLEAATKPSATIENIVAAKSKPHVDPVLANNNSLTENSVSQNKSIPSSTSNTANASVNLLDPRERLLTPVANNQIRLPEDTQLVDNKLSSDVTRPVGSQAADLINRPLDQNRFAFDAETTASQRKQEIPTQIDTADIRKENIIASTTAREQIEYAKQVDNRVSLQHRPEDLYKIANTQDRTVVKPDYSAPVQQNFIIESAPVVKFVEINIDQKSPVTINLGADAISSLRPVNSDYQLLPPREILQSDSTSPVVRASEIRNGSDIAEQIAWARQNNAQQVRISVTPEHLGAVDISIDDAADGLNIQFVAQNLQAKEALELFMPRLKEMLEQSGLNLQNASVSQQGEGKSQFNLPEQGGSELIQQDVDDDISVTETDVIHNQPAGSSDQLLDAFA